MNAFVGSMRNMALRGVRPVILASFLAGATLSSFAFQSGAEAPVRKDSQAAEQTASQKTVAQGPGPDTLDRPKPFHSIDLQALDFRPLSPLSARDGASHLSVDFVDQDRLLVTFEGTGLVRRLKSCPKTHDDRILHAVLFDYPSGKVLRRAEWYVHDRQRYLWRLDPGRALLRKGDQFVVLDRELNEKSLIEVPGLVWTDVTPDGKQLIVEIRKEDPSDHGGVDERKPSKYEVRFVDVATQSVLRTLALDRFTPMPATSDGYADVVLKNGWVWLVQFGSDAMHPVTRVRSVCVPDVEYSGENSMLIGRCTTAQGRYMLSSFTTKGQFLWRQRWSEQGSVPLITKIPSGYRFAVSTFASPEKPATTLASVEEMLQDRTQRIEVFNSATGTSVLAFETQPAVVVGQNFALSPDGNSLALLRRGRIELYNLPKPTKEEDSKFAAMEAGAPGLLAPASTGENADDMLSAADEAPLPPAPAQPAPGTLDASSLPPLDAAAKAPESIPGANDKGNAEAKSLPTFHSSAQAVVVDVLVTDAKGRPVTGLKQDDFSLTEDGAGQQIHYFEEHSLGSAPPASVAEFKHPTNIFSNVTSAAHADVATMVLLDTLNTPVQDQYRARDALVRYIKDKPKTESFALCVLSGPLRLVRGFTADENELLLAIRDKRAKPNASLISQMDQSSLDMIRNFTHSNNNAQDLTRAFETSMAGLERSIIEEQASQEEMRTHLTIDAFEQLARYLSGIPGRKNLVWLSAAFPLGKFASSGGLDAGPFKTAHDFSVRVRDAMNLLATAHVSVYPIDVRGVAVNTVFDAGAQTPFRQNLPNGPLTNPTGGGVPAGFGQDATTALNMTNDHEVPRPGAVEQNQEESVHRNSEHSAMDAVAEQTGGKAFYGTNDIADAVKRTVEQASDYYSLSYSPTNRKYDGGFRKIRLKLARRGYQVSYRAGYYADDPNLPPKNREALLKSLSMAGMTPGSPQSRQIPFEVRVVPVGSPKTGTPNQPQPEIAKADSAKEKNKGQDKGSVAPSAVKLQHYVVDFAISASQLRFEAGPEGNMHGKFQLLANSFDNDGHPMSRAANTASAEVKPADYGQVLTAGIRLRQELDVPAEASYLRLGVEDLTSPHIGTVELALPVPALSDDPTGRKDRVLPPVEPD